MTNLAESKKAPCFKNHRRIWLWIVASVLVLSILLIILLPHVIQWRLQVWLERQEHVSVHIEDVDFNPFTGALAVSTLHIKERNIPVLKVSIAKLCLDWWPFLKHRMQVKSISLEDIIITIRKNQEGTLAIGGLPVKTSASEPVEPENEPWAIGINAIDLRNVNIRYTAPKLRGDVTIVHAHVDPIATWNPDVPSRFNIEMRAADGSIKIEGETTPFSAYPSVVTKVRVDTLPLPLLAPVLKQQNIELLSGALNTDVILEAGYRPAHGTFQLDIEGEVQMQNLELISPPVKIRQKGLLWKGSVEIVPKEVRVNGTASLSGLGVADVETGSTIVDLHEVGIRDVQVRGTDIIEARLIRLDSLKSLERQQRQENGADDSPHILTLDELVAENVEVHRLRRIDVDRIRISGLDGWFAKGPQGDMELVQWFPSSSDGISKKEDTKDGLTVGINLFEISDDSRLVFEDRAVRPVFRLTMDPLEVRLKAIDQAHPQKKSPLEIRTRLSKYSTVAVNGTAALFAERPTMDLKVTLEAVELPPFTPYMARHMGYKIEKGHLSADADIRVNQGLLDIESNLVFDKFMLTSLRPDEEYEFTKQQGMPLNTALALLRDRNDVIHLRLPVKGDINDPKFGLGHALQQASINAIKSAILVYYVPSAVGKLVSLATALRFDPVEFSPGEYELKAAGTNYLDIIAKRLEERPKAQLTLSGKAVPIDAGLLAGSREDLLRLAQKRAETVKDYLTSQGRIEPQRLFIGNPEIDNNTEAKPRVDVSI